MSNDNGKDGKRIGWKGFIECPLRDRHIDDIKAWDVTPGMMLAFIQESNEQLYKVSCSYNVRNDGFIASMTDNDPSSGGKGYTLTAWAGSAQDALKVLMYKHGTILAEGWVLEGKPHQEMG